MALARHTEVRGSEVVAMAALLLILVPLQVLAQASAQQLNLLVLQTSVSWLQDFSPEEKDAYFLVNGSLRVLCKYTFNNDIDYCSRRNETNMTVTPSYEMGKELIEEILSNMVVVERTKCNVTIEIHNITTRFQGRYFCRDLLAPQLYYPRDFKIGEAPVAPENLSIVFEPGADIRVLFDPVKTGFDLNDGGTEWNIWYSWGADFQNCRGKDIGDSLCGHLLSSGLCQACVLPLETYRRCGQYGNVTVDHNFLVYWSVSNIFGDVSNKNSPMITRLSNWAKPGSVSLKKDLSTTSSTLVVSVEAPNFIDQGQFDVIESSPFPLYVQSSLTMISAREQCLMSEAGRRFHDAYAFVRNQEDEERALNDALGETNFSSVLKMQRWTSDETGCSLSPRAHMLSFEDLPFAGFHYNVTVTAKARYWGPPVILNLYEAKTNDMGPLEGPGLDSSFVYCLLPVSQSCTTCLLYFRDIPMTKRRGEVMEYRLTVDLDPVVDFPPVYEDCANRNGTVLTTGGHNNTFVISQLAIGGKYKVQIQAFTRDRLASPTTVSSFRVTASPLEIAPRDIVLEKSGVSYDLTWRVGKKEGEMNLTYFTHYCYTVPIQLSQRGPSIASTNSSAEAPLPLNCVTNMVTKKASEQTASIFDQVLSQRILTLVFFVSSVGPQGLTSGLQPVQCFYERGIYPKAVDENSIIAQPAEDDSEKSLLIRFSLPCGQDLYYNGGRPYDFFVAVLPYSDLCQKHCDNLMKGQGIKQEISGSLKDQVSYTWRDLQPQTKYCVGVNVAGRNGEMATWSCTVASTQKAGQSLIYLLLLLILFIIICVIIILVQPRFTRIRRKFGVLEMKLTIETSYMTKGMVNPMFNSDSDLNPLASSSDQVIVTMDTAGESTDNQAQIFSSETHFSAAAEDRVSINMQQDTIQISTDSKNSNNDNNNDSNIVEDSATDQSASNSHVGEDMAHVRARYPDQPSHDVMQAGQHTPQSSLTEEEEEEEDSDRFKGHRGDVEEDTDEDDSLEEVDWRLSQTAHDRYTSSGMQSSCHLDIDQILSSADRACSQSSIPCDMDAQAVSLAHTSPPEPLLPTTQGLDVTRVLQAAEKASSQSAPLCLSVSKPESTSAASGSLSIPPVFSHSEWHAQGREAEGGGFGFSPAVNAQAAALSLPLDSLDVDNIIQSLERSGSPITFHLITTGTPDAGDTGASCDDVLSLAPSHLSQSASNEEAPHIAVSHEAVKQKEASSFLPGSHPSAAAVLPTQQPQQPDRDSNPYNLEDILEAASKCPWKRGVQTPSPGVGRKGVDGTGQGKGGALHNMQRTCSQESGFHTQRSSSSDSGLDNLPSPIQQLSGVFSGVFSESSPFSSTYGTVVLSKAPTLHSQLSNCNSSSSVSEGNEAGVFGSSPTEPLLALPQHGVATFGADSPTVAATRL